MDGPITISFPREAHWQRVVIRQILKSVGKPNRKVAIPEIFEWVRGTRATDLGIIDMRKLTPPLGKVPQCLFRLGFDHLSILLLGSNKILRLPSSVGLLSSLRELHVESNLLVILPPEIGQLINLMFLNLNGNEIDYLPPTLVNLRKLEMLMIGLRFKHQSKTLSHDRTQLYLQTKLKPYPYYAVRSALVLVACAAKVKSCLLSTLPRRCRRRVFRLIWKSRNDWQLWIRAEENIIRVKRKYRL
jgi:Leucine-rich repeat (LRR) protein